MYKNMPGLLLAFLALSVGAALAGEPDKCQYEVVESMPDGLDLKDPNGEFRTVPTHKALLKMINGAQKSLSIASFYWMMTAEEKFQGHTDVIPGQMIMAAIAEAVARGVKLEVVLDGSTRREMSNEEDVKKLKELGTVKRVNMTQLLGAGVVHSKYMIADNQSVYIGSSNFDWRSYTEIKEMGIAFYNCDEVAQDLDKLFQTYMLMADADKIPSELPAHLNTTINIDHPFELKMDGIDMKMYLAGAPPAFNGDHNSWTGRTDDIDAILHLIDTARKRISISVMNYSPKSEFSWPQYYWPLIDDALRRAATVRKVRVELLFSKWTQTKELDTIWYKSLNALQGEALRGGGIHVKMFEVPAFDDHQKSIPFSRVKHDKYMVTDNSVYFGTSNWAPSYFIDTCGVGVVIQPKNWKDLQYGKANSIVRNMQDLFDRDFGSQYAHELPM